MLLAILGLVFVVAIVGIIGFFTLGKQKDIIQGEVEVEEFRVACKYPGRVVELRVKEGDYVHVGDTFLRWMHRRKWRKQQLQQLRQ